MDDRRDNVLVNATEAGTARPVAGSPWVFRAEHVGFSYETGLEVVRDLDLSVNAGEITTILGPSGCGKSTILSIAAGLLAPTGGSIHWNTDIVGPSSATVRRPERRRLSIVFQKDTVFPWLTVRQNVEFGFRYIALGAAERRRRLGELLELGNLAEFADAYPRQLSGGMRRRLAVLQGVAPLPHVLLLDEPFVGLDEPTRVRLHVDLLRIVRRLDLTVLLVTHDVSEAISLADQICVLTNRPTHVRHKFATGLGTTRDLLELRLSEQYTSLYGQVWQELWATGGVASEENGQVGAR